MLVPAPHDSSVLVIVRFEHFESVPIKVLGTRTISFNPPKWLTAQHQFLIMLCMSESIIVYMICKSYVSVFIYFYTHIFIHNKK
jgi:hypothetical protein